MMTSSMLRNVTTGKPEIVISMDDAVIAEVVLEYLEQRMHSALHNKSYKRVSDVAGQCEELAAAIKEMKGEQYDVI